MEQVIEFAGYSASEATKILTQATSDLVDFGKESLWAYYESGPSGVKGQDIEKELNSNYEAEKLSALKKLIVMMGKGQDCRRHFAAVIKNVAFNSFAVKRLVYVYLLKYAEQEPDLALLSINSFQKDLLDPNPMIRSVALRVLCSIKVTIIASVQLAAVKKGAVDMSPYVRKAVSVSLVKISKLEPSSQEEILEILKTLLDDKSAIVLGSAIQSMNDLCPDRFDLIHKHFKKICSLVLEVDEWGQIQILKMMDRYCRLHFTNPSSSVHIDHSEEQLISGNPIIGVNQKDTDYELFQESCRQLLASKNPLIVMMASRISYDQPLDNPTRHLAARSLIRCLSRPKQEQHMLLVAIKSLIIIDPSPWFKHITSFAVYSTEIDEIKILKLDILVLLATETNTNWIVPELKYYSSCHDSVLSLHSIKCWRTIVTKIPSIVQLTLESLIHLLSHPNSNIVGEAIITIRLLLSATTKLDSIDTKHEKLLIYLVSTYDQITVPQARASILWLIGRNIQVPTFKHGPDLLRISLKTFKSDNTEQDSIVKLQILVFSTLLKIHISLEPQLYIEKCISFVKEANQIIFKLARLDDDFDVRDYGRFLEGCMNYIESESKQISIEDELKLKKRFFDLLSHFRPVSKVSVNEESPYPIESLSHFLESSQPGYTPLPQWAISVRNSDERKVDTTQQENSTTRNQNSSQTIVQPISTRKNRITATVTLDDFYGESTTSSSNNDLCANEDLKYTINNEKISADKLWALDSEDSSSLGSDLDNDK